MVKYYKVIFSEAGTLRCMGIAMLISIIILAVNMLPFMKRLLSSVFSNIVATVIVSVNCFFVA